MLALFGALTAIAAIALNDLTAGWSGPVAFLVSGVGVATIDLRSAVTVRRLLRDLGEMTAWSVALAVPVLVVVVVGV